MLEQLQEPGAGGVLEEQETDQVVPAYLGEGGLTKSRRYSAGCT